MSKVSKTQEIRTLADLGYGVTAIARTCRIRAVTVRELASENGIVITDKRRSPEHADRMRRLRADPRFMAKIERGRRLAHGDTERNPLAQLTPEQRADYDIVKRNGHTRVEALLIIGRADLVRETAR